MVLSRLGKVFMNKKDSIAVFDSGIGGLSVLRRLREVMPAENYLYYGDSANAPYGQKSREEIESLCENVTEKLIREGIKCVVIACNTATSAAIGYLSEKHPDLRFIGIEPAVAWAAEELENPSVLTLATNYTIHGERYQNSVKSLSGKGTFTGKGAPGLVTFVESGVTDTSVTEECRTYIRSLFDGIPSGPDAIVLGCTHFPFLSDTIRKEAALYFGKEPAMFDAAVITARKTREYLLSNDAQSDRNEAGTVRLMNSDPAKIGLMKELYES